MHEFLYTATLPRDPLSFWRSRREDAARLSMDFVYAALPTLRWIPWKDLSLRPRPTFQPEIFGNVLDAEASPAASKVFDGWRRIVEQGPDLIELTYGVDADTGEKCRCREDRNVLLTELAKIASWVAVVQFERGYIVHSGC